MNTSTTHPAPQLALIALSECPFCGGSARLECCPTDHESTHWWVQCFGCGATNGESLAESTPDQEFAITAWNTRAPQSRPEAELPNASETDRLLAALERAGRAESVLRRLVDECDNDRVPGWEDRMQACIAEANGVLSGNPALQAAYGQQCAATRPAEVGGDGVLEVSDTAVLFAIDGFNEAAGTGELFLGSLRDKVRMKFALKDALQYMEDQRQNAPGSEVRP